MHTVRKGQRVVAWAEHDGRRVGDDARACGRFLGCESGDANVAALIGAIQSGMAGGHGAGEQKSLRLSEAELKEASVVTTPFKARRPAKWLALTACVNPTGDRLARVAPRVEGQVIEVKAELGREVSAGEELAVINSIPLSDAQAEHRRAESEHRLAEADHQRVDELFRREVVSQRFWQETRATFVRASAALRLSSDRLRAFGVSPESGEPHMRIVAPFGGSIIEKSAVLGELAGPGKSMFTVADLSSVWIEADVLETDVNKIAMGSTATVRAPAYPGETFEGVVTHLSSALDRRTRTMKARIETPNTARKLSLNMFVTAEIQLPDGGDEVSTLPEGAVVAAQGRTVVYVRTQDGVEARPIEAGERANGRVVVSSGLSDGDEVVVAGTSALKERLFGATFAQGR